MKKAAPTGNSLIHNQSKDNNYLPQLQKVHEYFEQNLASRLMCSEAIGIRISNVCWLVDMLFDGDEIKVCRKDFCHISGEFVQFLSCNRDFWPVEFETQLSLFEEGRADR